MILYPYSIRTLADMAAYCSSGALPDMGVRSSFGKSTGFLSLSKIVLIFTSSSDSGNTFEYFLLSLSSQGKAATRVSHVPGHSLCFVRRAGRLGYLLDYGLGDRWHTVPYFFPRACHVMALDELTCSFFVFIGKYPTQLLQPHWFVVGRRLTYGPGSQNLRELLRLYP